MNRRGKYITGLLAFVAIVAGVSAYWMPRYMEAAWFLADISAERTASTTWKNLHKPPKQTLVTWTIEGRAGEGDLYTPDGPIRGRMIFVPGLVEKARTDDRVIAFATTLARAGFVTLVPDTAAFTDMRATPADITTVSDASAWLFAADIPNAPKDKVGVTALSYMSGPVILAAAHGPASDQIGYICLIGGYYSMTDVIRFVTTRQYRLNDTDPWSGAPPADYALWAFLKANAQGVDDASDVATLTAIADKKLADPGADVSGLAATLQADGRPVYALVENRDPEKVDALVAALPPRLKTGLEALDPARQNLSGLKAEVLLIHGKDDPFIPAVQSEKLAKALGDRADLYVLEEVTHVEVNKPGSWWDKVEMLFAGRKLLSFRS